jgi:hypothetical protein
MTIVSPFYRGPADLDVDGLWAEHNKNWQRFGQFPILRCQSISAALDSSGGYCGDFDE